ncbi:hypothetical protein [Histidinibacterium aquaticum]|uniref:Uncharacterized protein n=1 Tax=Histidinibacterium aquaticum TaxID=2613962 RepID=A0A5J5GNH2_9RHOB|nr:hypothetical protein [Histidinibacterium aquaticum]KAA9009936.1 hypothetical protein F3S47_01320 [Histidinibacterium aquaticum]
MIRLGLVLALFPLASVADGPTTASYAPPVAEGMPMDGGWSEPDPAMLQPMTPADLRAMVEQDGDPETLTADEAAMLELLGQLLGASPLEQQEP